MEPSIERIKCHSRIDDCLKPRDRIQKQRLKQRQKSKRGSFLKAVRGFLMADSFMYGPLTAKSYRTPGVRYISAEEREKKSATDSPISILKDVFSSPGDARKETDRFLQVIDRMEETSEASEQVVQGTYTSVHKTVKRTAIVLDDAKMDLRVDLTGVIPHDQRSSDIRVDGELMSHDTRADAEQSEPEGDEEHSWSVDGGDDSNEHIPLDDSVAEKVANQLIVALGGRFSDDLGINVDVSDSEVERWFLAANLFSRNISIDVSKNTYKELQEAGLSKMSDVAVANESTLVTILEKTGYTKYGQRVASMMMKLAHTLEENHWGRITTFKHASDNYDELVRQLRSLPGVKLSTARTFLRELQGVWKGARPELEMRIKRAAMHLKLLGPIKSSSNPESVLSTFAQESGIDLRDLEVALYKLGAEHERHYRECPGGVDCKVLLRFEQVVAS